MSKLNNVTDVQTAGIPTAREANALAMKAALKEQCNSAAASNSQHTKRIFLVEANVKVADLRQRWVHFNVELVKYEAKNNSSEHLDWTQERENNNTVVMYKPVQSVSTCFAMV